MFVVYCDPFEPYEPISEWDGDVQRQANINIKQDKDNYLCNPLLENEHVDVDAEIMYLEDALVRVLTCCDKEKDKDYCCDDESEDAPVQFGSMCELKCMCEPCLFGILMYLS
jgi:hypothetical protein